MTLLSENLLSSSGQLQNADLKVKAQKKKKKTNKLSTYEFVLTPEQHTSCYSREEGSCLDRAKWERAVDTDELMGKTGSGSPLDDALRRM